MYLGANVLAHKRWCSISSTGLHPTLTRTRTAVLKQGVATHLCVAGFFLCVAKNFWDIIVRKDHANLSFKYKNHGILSQKCVAKIIKWKMCRQPKKGWEPQNKKLCPTFILYVLCCKNQLKSFGTKASCRMLMKSTPVEHLQ